MIITDVMGDYVKDLVCNSIEGREEFCAVLELSDLPFVVRQESKYMCKHCLGLLNK